MIPPKLVAAVDAMVQIPQTPMATEMIMFGLNLFAAIVHGTLNSAYGM
jgi:hypothetical protein